MNWKKIDEIISAFSHVPWKTVFLPYLQIQVHHFVLMHILDALADLSHEQYAVSFGQGEIVGNHPLEKLAARNTRVYVL